MTLRQFHSAQHRRRTQTPTSGQRQNGRHGVHQAEGGGAGQQRDPLQGEANHPDGQVKEELQREGRSYFLNVKTQDDKRRVNYSF